MRDKPNKRIVYSTDLGRQCPECGLTVAQCQCRRSSKAAATGSGKQQNVPNRNVPNRNAPDGIVRLQYSIKGRSGKPVVVISGLGLDAKKLKEMARDLKNQCGSGGTIEDGNILIQGDKRNQLTQLLENMGYKVKLSGG